MSLDETSTAKPTQFSIEDKTYETYRGTSVTCSVHGVSNAYN